MDKTHARGSLDDLGAAEWEVLYLLFDALDQLRKMTLSFSEVRYLAVEHTEAQLRDAVENLLQASTRAGVPLIVQIPNLANLPIYRITPAGRDLVAGRRGGALYERRRSRFG